MAYTPLNNFVFAAAYAGVMSAMTSGNRQITDTISADYGGLAGLAGAFAQAFDTAWGASAVPSWTDLMLIQSSVQGYWQDRQMQNANPFVSPATWTAASNAIIATVKSADAYFAAQGIPAPTNPGGVSGGITQLTGDATAGPGSGSQAVIVVKVNGASVPVSGALNTGNVLQVTGGASLGYAAVNLAGGGTFVTGVLPTGNQASQSMSGDVNGTTGSSTVVAIQGNAFTAGGPTKGQFVVALTSSSYGPVALSNDISESATAPGSLTVVGIQSHSVPSPPGAGTTVLTDTNGTLSWAAAASGGLTAPVTSTTRTEAANYTLDASGSDYIIFADTSGAAWTLTMVAPANGRCFVVIDVKGTFSTNNLTLAPHGAEKINGIAGTKPLSGSGGIGARYEIVSNGTDWFVQ